MRSIKSIEARQIVDLINEEGLSIDAFALEKDFHVGAALSALSKIRDPAFDLIFCGGTCLSKAYGLLERLSEDVDIKVVLKPGVVEPDNKLRPTLSKLKQTIVESLISEGFDPEQFEETHVVEGKTMKVAIDARDSNRYITLNVRYSSHFDKPGDMRSRLQIELNYTSLSMPKVSRSAESLFDRLRGADPKSAVKMDCVDLTEAAIEKLISFPRRLAMHMRSVAKNPGDPAKHRPLDPTLVRHIYDIHEINRLVPGAFVDHESLSKLMRNAIKKDADDFMLQHPEFADYPVSELKMAMSEASSNPDIEAAYLRFMNVMVYGDQRPDFISALAVFDRLLSIACAPHSELSFKKEREERERRLQSKRQSTRGLDEHAQPTSMTPTTSKGSIRKYRQAPRARLRR